MKKILLSSLLAIGLSYAADQEEQTRTAPLTMSAASMATQIFTSHRGTEPATLAVSQAAESLWGNTVEITKFQDATLVFNALEEIVKRTTNFFTLAPEAQNQLLFASLGGSNVRLKNQLYLARILTIITENAEGLGLT